MSENSIQLWDDVDKSEFDFEEYYVNALRKKGNILNRDEIYHRMQELKARMASFITLDVLKMPAFAESDNKLLSSLELWSLITAYQTPLLPKKTRVSMISDALTLQFNMWGSIDKNDVQGFADELACLSLQYSTTLDEETSMVARAAISAIQGYFKKMAKKVVPIGPLEIKWLLASLYHAIGIFIINRDYLIESQGYSVEEAKIIYKKVMVYRKKNTMLTLLSC